MSVGDGAVQDGGADDERHFDRSWRGPAVLGLGSASLFADAGGEIPTSLLPSFLTATLGAPAAALGIIEGLSDAMRGAARVFGGAVADDPRMRQRAAVTGFTASAILGATVGLATNAVQVGLLRAGAWTAKGLHTPARNALLMDAVDPEHRGRAFGLERAMDSLGSLIGPSLALVLVASVGVRNAMLISVVPGMLAVVSVIYAIRHMAPPQPRERQRLRLRIRPVINSPLGPLVPGIAFFEFGKVATTLLILRATELLIPEMGIDRAASLGIAMIIGYNAASTAASIPAGRAIDRRGSVPLLSIGVAFYLLAYVGLAVTSASLVPLAACFVIAGIAHAIIGTAERTVVGTFAPPDAMGSAFGLLAAIQGVGNLAASAIAGVLWTVFSPSVAYGYAASLMVLAVIALGLGAAPSRARAQASN